VGSVSSKVTVLNDRRPQPDGAAEHDIAHPQANEIATAQLAVDRQIEHDKIAYAMIVLQARSDRPNMTRLQRGLWPNQTTRVPGRVLITSLIYGRSAASPIPLAIAL
jgi:hypothetical protein